MAPLPDNNTARFWTDYTVRGNQHAMLCRVRTPEADADYAANVVGNLLSFLAPYLASSFLVIGARFAAAGSTISLPVDITGTPLAGLVGENADDLFDAYRPRETVYVGRSPTSGRRVRFSLYGGMYNTPGNFRFGPGENPFTDSAVFAALNAASGVGAFVAIDESPAVWYTYANVNFNSYWETEVRG